MGIIGQRSAGFTPEMREAHPETSGAARHGSR
jgi:hypothetical protein